MFSRLIKVGTISCDAIHLVKGRSHSQSLFSAIKLCSSLTMDTKILVSDLEDRTSENRDNLIKNENEIKLDRSKFDRTISVPFLELEKKNANNLLLHLKPYLFKAINLSAIGKPKDGAKSAEDSSKEKEKIEQNKLEVMLDPEKVKSVDDFTDQVKERLIKYKVDEDIKFKDIKLTYENLTADQVFKQIIPFKPDENLSSFSTIGHIIHVNLRDHLLPYKKLIGQVLLDKHTPRIRLVVNKLSEIDTEFRFFQMETLAHAPGSSPNDTIVTVNHAKCRLKFDFAKVYWNPRLDTEHCRIIERLRPGNDILYDVFAGVGPFAIPCGKRKNQVLANDLNPECDRWMRENVRSNRVGDYVQVFNQDGRDFIRNTVKDHILKEWIRFDSGEDGRIKEFHITMNLPGLAIDFLDAFVGWFSEEMETIQKLTSYTLPIIHCYCFMKKDPDEGRLKQDLIQRIQNVISYKLNDDEIEQIKMVRNVSPGKEMYRITFRLPKDVVICKNKKLKTS